MLREGITYAPHIEFYQKMQMTPIWYPGTRPAFYDSLMVGEYTYEDGKGDKYLDVNSEASSREEAKYVIDRKRVLLSSGLDRLMIFEYYAPIDETEGTTAVRGGEVRITDMPVYPGYVPIRAVAEELGYAVSWDGATESVYIDTMEKGGR